MFECAFDDWPQTYCYIWDLLPTDSIREGPPAHQGSKTHPPWYQDHRGVLGRASRYRSSAVGRYCWSVSQHPQTPSKSHKNPWLAASPRCYSSCAKNTYPVESGARHGNPRVEPRRRHLVRHQVLPREGHLRLGRRKVSRIGRGILRWDYRGT